MIQREKYLHQLREARDKKIIKVITGMRRSGKSTLLQMFQQELRESGVAPEQIIYINFEDMQFYDLITPKALHDYVDEKITSDVMHYLFFDEIQILEHFEQAINSLFLRSNVDIYLTGSNAHLLSGEIATLLSGRYIEIPVMLLSFREYLLFRTDTKTKSLIDLYYDYQRYSSFPYAVTELGTNAEMVDVYLEGIFNTVVLKDIVARKNVADVMMLESVIRFLFDNIGCMLSTKKIADTMKSDGRSISVGTVESYVSGLVDSYSMYQAKRFDVKGRQHLKTNEKYYVADIGLRYHLLGSAHVDEGRILENLVYLELLHRGYDVYVGKVDTYEIDFVAMKQNTVEYYQVALTVRDPDTLARELRPLNLVTDHYPKFLITEDRGLETDYQGIRKVNILDFLVGSQ